MRKPAKGRRPGFTLVELLVVITIIIVLIAILVPAVLSALAKGRDTLARSEIGQMENGIAACRRECGDLKYPLPSRLKLSEANNYPNAGTAGTDDYNSVQLLTAMFGNRWLTSPFIDWNGNGTKDADVVLQGDQVLVFLLGGIPSASSSDVLGFSTSPTNPADLTSTTRKGPYFPFSPDRLMRQSNGFFQYLDPYKTGTPYIYLSAGKTRNGYNVTTTATGTVTDCPQLPLPRNPPAGATAQPIVIPYKNGASGLFLNPDSYQIISAGSDGVFGPGGSWDPTQGYGSPSAGTPAYFGKDDLSNFSPNKLGSPAG